jgi:hypothetical protein
MNYNKINALLEKYWDAETSIEEEKELQHYFSGADVHPDHLEFQDLFVFFKLEKEHGISLEKAMAGVNQEIKNTGGGSAPAKVISLRRWGLSIAAGLIMIFGAITIWENYANTATSTSSYASAEIENPEEALEVTLEALSYLSGKMKKGTAPVKAQMEKVKSQDIFK